MPPGRKPSTWSDLARIEDVAAQVQRISEMANTLVASLKVLNAEGVEMYPGIELQAALDEVSRWVESGLRPVKPLVKMTGKNASTAPVAPVSEAVQAITGNNRLAKKSPKKSANS